MVARFDEVFDGALLNSIASSRVGQDWQAMGWRGIMLGSGEVWLDFDGKVIGINHQTAQAAKRKAELVAKQKSDLYPGLREYQRPELMWQTEKFTIRIDDLGDGVIAMPPGPRARRSATSRTWCSAMAPSGWRDGGNHTYLFTSGPYRYECAVTVLGERGTPPGELVVYQNEVAIMHQPVIKVL